MNNIIVIDIIVHNVVDNEIVVDKVRWEEREGKRGRGGKRPERKLSGQNRQGCSQKLSQRADILMSIQFLLEKRKIEKERKREREKERKREREKERKREREKERKREREKERKRKR